MSLSMAFFLALYIMAIVVMVLTGIFYEELPSDRLKTDVAIPAAVAVVATVGMTLSV